MKHISIAMIYTSIAAALVLLAPCANSKTSQNVINASSLSVPEQDLQTIIEWVLASK